MDELYIKFIYNGEKSLFTFLKNIELDVKGKFDKNVWFGDVKIGNTIFKTRDEVYKYFV